MLSEGILYLAQLFITLDRKNVMSKHNKKEEQDPEPPELRDAHVPPLKRVFGWYSIGVAVVILLVLIFALILIF